jgi:hypothetical protein
MLKGYLRNCVGGSCGLDFSGPGLRSETGFFEYGNEIYGSTKYWECLDWLSESWLLKKGSVPWS